MLGRIYEGICFMVSHYTSCQHCFLLLHSDHIWKCLRVLLTRAKLATSLTSRCCYFWLAFGTIEPWSTVFIFIDDAYLQPECSLCEVFLYIDESTSECVRPAVPVRNIRRRRRGARQLISAHFLPVLLLVNRLIVDDQVLAWNNKPPPSCLHCRPDSKWCFYVDSIGDIFCIDCCLPPDLFKRDRMDAVFQWGSVFKNVIHLQITLNTLHLQITLKNLIHLHSHNF